MMTFLAGSKRQSKKIMDVATCRSKLPSIFASSTTCVSVTRVPFWTQLFSAKTGKMCIDTLITPARFGLNRINSRVVEPNSHYMKLSCRKFA